MRGPESAFADIAESYLRSKHDLRAWTKRSYAKSFARIGQRCPTIGELTLDLMNDILAEHLESRHATIAHHDGGAAKRLAAWTVAAKILSANPLAGLSVPTQPKHRRKPFDDADVPLILAAARASQHSERDEAIVSLALACGLRKDEIHNLAWPADVDLQRKVLWVRDTKTEAGTRCVPISARVARPTARGTPRSRTGDAPASTSPRSRSSPATPTSATPTTTSATSPRLRSPRCPTRSAGSTAGVSAR